MNLYGVDSSDTVQCVDLRLGGRFQLVPRYVAADLEMMDSLLAAFEFERRAIVLFGKSVLQPRLISWAGDHPYTYSGDTLEARPWPQPAAKLLAMVNTTLAEVAPTAPAFNHVLANLYRDGSDSMGLHADDEHELGPAPFIASLSFGATRSFQIAPKRKYRTKSASSETLNLLLTPGSLLLMAPPMQRYYVHGLKKTTRQVGPRLNLTFRSVRTR